MIQDTGLGSTNDFLGGLFSTTCGFIYFAFFVLVVVGLWKMYEKAGRPGWAAIIPIYNIWVLLEIIGRPGWWLILLLIPIVNFVIWIIIAIDLARSFGHDILFALGLMFFPEVFYLILGFGGSEYRGPAAA